MGLVFGWASHSRLPAGNREEARPRAQLGGAGMQAGRGRGSPWRRRASGTVSAQLGRNRRDGLAEEVPRSGYGGSVSDRAIEVGQVRRHYQ
jgi:hypothetical protein